VNTQQQPKAKNGQFRKLRQTERIVRDAASGLTVNEIAKKRNVRYQTVWRALKGKERTKFVAKHVELDPESEPCNNADCMTGKSPICECVCEGRWHGAGVEAMAQLS
jgi:hypothetical protein